MSANSRIGAENFTISKVLTDVAGGSTTYDTPYPFTKKLIKLGVKNKTSAEMQYADDMCVDIYSEDGDVELDIENTDVTEDELSLLMGQTMVAGVRTPNPGTDVRPYFSVSWKSKKRDGTYKYYKVLKVMFKEPDSDFETKKDKLSSQTDKISGTGIQRLSDGLRKRIADASSTSYVAGTGSGWFTTGDITPDTTPPTVTVVPIDTEAAFPKANNIVWTFSEAILPSCVTGANFFVMIASDGTAIAGVLSIGTNDTVVTFNPTNNLTTVAHIAICTTNVKDKSGNALAANSVINFTAV